ncbi:MAG: ABC transporter permease [Armatimonadota bacterium]|nr:ABC transporter permease [Armatimonadota bacterium]MDW8157170.1 ABC transporter permease [Armatimonadota bacterium]
MARLAGWPSLVRNAAAGLAPLLAVAVAWELLARGLNLNPNIFPGVARVVDTWWELARSGVLWKHVFLTLYRLAVGLALACVAGLVVGTVMGVSRTAERFFLPLAGLLLPVPALAWLPVLVLWLGLGNRSTIALAAFTSALPMMLSVWSGIRQCPEVLLRAATVMGSRGVDRFWRVLLPAALPSVMTGLRLALGQSWRAVVAGEMIGTTDFGLGLAIFLAREFLRADIMLASLATIAVLGLLMERGMREVENRTVRRWGTA